MLIAFFLTVKTSDPLCIHFIYTKPASKTFLSLARFRRTLERICLNRMRYLLSMRCMLLGYSFEPRLNSRALGSSGSVMTIGFINKRMIAPRGVGYSGFQVTGMIEWGQNQNPKKSLGRQTKLKKILGPKFNPKIIPCRISEP